MAARGRPDRGGPDLGARLLELVRRRSRGLADADLLALRTESPVDVAAHNPQNIGGSCHGGVVAGWQRYDTDVPGLFLTGLGLDPLQVMGPG